MNPPESALPRLQTDANIWLATVRSSGKPHLVPVWFAYHDNEIYICIQSNSVKAKNMAANPLVSLSLEDGSKVAICEGTAVSLTTPPPLPVLQIMKQKYNWDLPTDADYDLVVKITPQKWLSWGSDAE